MTVLIKVDQTAAPPGVPGQAREDLVTGVGVTLTAVGGPFLAYQWSIVSKPIDITVPVQATSLLGSPTAAASTLSPIDVAGTYLVEVSVDSGSGLGAGVGDVARITFYAGPTLNTNSVFLPRRKMAAFESTEHNVPDAIQPLGNTEGWSREWYRWFAALEHVIAGKGWSSAKVNDVGTALRSFNLASVNLTGGPPFNYEVRFTTPTPDAQYLINLTAFSPVATYFPTITNQTTAGFDVHFFDENGVSSICGFFYQVFLGV